MERFFTSDTHYHHTNICKGVTKWKDSTKTRDFKDLGQMDNCLVDSINAMVGAEDELWHLGDWSFGGFERIQEFRDRIACRKVHLIYGNHDDNIIENRSQQKLFESVQFYKELFVGKNRIILFHFPLKVWHKVHRGSWMLHGHCHGSLHSDRYWLQGFVKDAKDRKTMDVGVDTNNYRPYSLDQIAKVMASRHDHDVDHHKSEE